MPPLDILFAASPRDALGLPQIDGSIGALVKMLLPVVAFLAMAPVLWLFFRKTWRELDDEATEYRRVMRLLRQTDYRPAVMFAIVALILTMQEYYGGSRFYSSYVRPWLREPAVAWRLHPEPGSWGQYVDTMK